MGVEDFGVFVNIDESELSGLCHLSEVSEQYVKDVKKAYSAGDQVKVAVLRVNNQNKHISLSMKSEHFEDESEEEDDIDDENDEEKELADSSEGEDVGGDMLIEEEDDEEDDEEESEDETDALPATGLQWDGFEMAKKASAPDEESDDDDDDESDDDEELPDSKTQRRKKKQKQQKQHEAAVQEREAAALAGDSQPETVADFERLVLEHPNSSFAWIKFIAFHIYLTDIDKAREMSKRAIETISSNEGQERMQVWVAWMNLEHKFGDSQSTMEVAQNAANGIDAKEVYMKLLDIYDEDENLKVAEEVYKNVSRKLRGSAQIWSKYCLFKLKNRQGQGARKVLELALASTPKRKHIGILSKFAQLEFKHGAPERGRTMFDSLLSSQPKRLDLWNVWLQCEIKQGDLDATRRLFEKVCAMSWSSKKMKFLLKSYLSFEKTEGTKDGMDRVRELATSYVDSKT